MDIRKQKRWEDAINKENMLRLKWFRRNETRLEESANKELSHMVSQAVKDDIKASRQHTYRDREKFTMLQHQEELPPAYDESMIKNVMRPVDPETMKLLYSGTQKDGRLNYLHERNKIKPEDKYYFPETTSFRYGWKMWDHAKSRVNLGHGNQQIIQNSFYRRRGVGYDPEWYKQPATLSSKACGIL